jgi:hypothetical protein
MIHTRLKRQISVREERHGVEKTTTTKSTHASIDVYEVTVSDTKDLVERKEMLTVPPGPTPTLAHARPTNWLADGMGYLAAML